MSETEQPRDEGSLRGVKRFLWLLLVCALILAVWGIVSRVRGRDRIGEETARDAIPVVRVAEPAASPATPKNPKKPAINAMIRNTIA